MKKPTVFFFCMLVFLLAGCQVSEKPPVNDSIPANGTPDQPPINVTIPNATPEQVPNETINDQEALNYSFYCTRNNNGYSETSVGFCSGLGCIPKGCVIGKALDTASVFDLGVAYIGRTPRYYRYSVIYEDDLPRLKPGTERLKRWPDVGEKVNYSAHVVNNNGISAPFTYLFMEDGNIVSIGFFNYSLGPKEAAVIRYEGGFKPGSNMSVKILPEGNDLYQVNNELSIGSDDLTISIWVEKGQYEQLNSRINLAGTSSFEDWVQWHFSVLNQRFSQARYNFSPEGILDRVRVDKIVVAENLDGGFSDPDEFLIDGRWSFSDNDPSNSAGISGAWKKYAEEYAGKTDFGLIHELAHQLGIIDLYRLNLPNDPEKNNRIEIKDINSELLPYLRLPTFAWGQAVFEHGGLMGGGSISPYADGTYFESHTAAGMNSHNGKRRGFYGEYLYDTPEKTSVIIRNKNMEPVGNAEVFFYQKNPADEVFDSTPEIKGTTDDEGRIDLSNRETPTVITETGHSLRPNPFGKINVVGTNGIMIVQVFKDGKEGYGFFLLTDLNMEYWKGNKSAAVVEVNTNFPLDE